MKKFPPSLSLVIPVYNNERSLVGQLNACLAEMKKLPASWEIVIANDASSDRSDILLKRYAKLSNVRIFSHKENKGIADNLRFLYNIAKSDYICLFSIDGDWDPGDIGRMYNELMETYADIVIGKRLTKGYSMYRHLVSFFYSVLPLLFFKVTVVDPGSIKIFSRAFYKNLEFYSKGVFFEAEMIIKAKKRGLNVVSIPVAHTRGKQTKALGGTLRYVLPAIKDLITLRLKGLSYE